MSTVLVVLVKLARSTPLAVRLVLLLLAAASQLWLRPVGEVLAMVSQDFSRCIDCYRDRLTSIAGKDSSSLDSPAILVTPSSSRGATSGVSSVLLSSEAVPEPEGLGISSSLGVAG